MNDQPSGAPDLETFVRRVTEALQASPARTRYEQIQRELEPRRRAPDRARQQAAREGVLPWLSDLDWTPSRWATEAGVDPSVTLGAGRGRTWSRRLDDPGHAARALGGRGNVRRLRTLLIAFLREGRADDGLLKGRAILRQQNW